jgi:S1-C subfamily serine protease
MARRRNRRKSRKARSVRPPRPGQEVIRDGQLSPPPASGPLPVSPPRSESADSSPERLLGQARAPGAAAAKTRENASKTPECSAKWLLKQAEAVGASAPKTPKDAWEKLSVIATFISSVLIAAIALAFTITYQRTELENRQLVQRQNLRQEELRTRLQELDLVTKLLPSLSSQDQNVKRQAYLTIKALGNTELMIKLALDDASFGAQAALVAVSNSPQSTASDRKLAHQGLNRISSWDAAIMEATQSVVRVLSYEAGRYRSSSGFIWHEPNLVVTSLHSIAGASSIIVTVTTASGPGRSYTAAVYRVLRRANLALLKLDVMPTPEIKPLQVASRTPSRGESLAITGYAFDMPDPLHSWTLSRQPKATRLRDVVPDKVLQEIKQHGFISAEQEVLSLEGNVVAEFSGAPILDAGGNAIGICAGGSLTDYGISWAIPASNLQALLDSKEKPLTEAEIAKTAPLY